MSVEEYGGDPPAIDKKEWYTACHFFQMMETLNYADRFKRVGDTAEHMYLMIHNAIRVAANRFDAHNGALSTAKEVGSATLNFIP